MSMMKRSIFREQAIQHYAQGRDKDVLPRFVSPPVFIFLWILLSLCVAIAWVSWSIRLPVSITGMGTIVASSSAGVAQAILFVAADQQREVHAGEPVEIQIGSTAPRLRSITSVAPTLLSPEEARQRYHLDGALSLLVIQPGVVVIVMLDASIPASTYAGSIVHAQIQVSRRSILTFLPIIGQMIGE